MLYDDEQRKKYDVPSTQYVLIKGNSGIEPISVPGLQNFYSNLMIAGREYGYIQVAHFDFPVNDSPTKIFGTDLIYLQLVVTIQFGPPNSAAFVGIGIPEPVTEVFETPLTVTIKRTAGIPDIAERLYQAIVSSLTIADPDKYKWKQWVKGLYYDETTQKINMSLGIPSELHLHEGDSPLSQVSKYPARFVFDVTSTHKGRQAKYAAQLFGGIYNSSTDSWSAQWDSGICPLYAAMVYYYGASWPATGYEWLAQYKSLRSWQVLGQRPARMYVDPYIYVMGGTDQSVWTSQGDATNILAMQPRNRPPGAVTQEQAFLAQQTIVSKTALPALRSMTLRLVDSDGNIVQVDEDYVIKINISFEK